MSEPTGASGVALNASDLKILAAAFKHSQTPIKVIPTPCPFNLCLFNARLIRTNTPSPARLQGHGNRARLQQRQLSLQRMAQSLQEDPWRRYWRIA